MGIKTGIAWCHSTFNSWWGCVRVSPACENCYAESFAKRTGHDVWGVNASRRFFGDKHWNEPLLWNAEAARRGVPWFVFTSSMADVFEDRRDLDAPRARLFKLIEATPALTWLPVTKRYKEALTLTPSHWQRDGWPINAWAGMTVENQEWAEKRIPYLLRVPARRRFLSMEPMLGPVRLDFGVRNPNPVAHPGEMMPAISGIDWCIIGGESGHGARPLDLDAVRAVIAQCNAAGIDPFVKQLGQVWAMKNRRPLQKADLHGGDISLWPKDLRVQRRPAPIVANIGA
jgi:protein gp37